jgi:hypothetical protein
MPLTHRGDETLCGAGLFPLSAIAIGCLMALLPHAPALANDPPTSAVLAPDNSRLVVPQTLAAEPSSSVALRIAVPSPRDLPPNAFVRIRGLPPAVSLTDGYAVAPGVWAVPISSLSNLRLIVPVGLAGLSDVVVSLVTVDGAGLAEGRMQLTIAAQPPPIPMRSPVVRAAPAPPPAAAAPVVALSPEARERADKLVQRGEQELANGNVAQARAFFTRAADSGLARGALMLASTFDPGELSRLKVQGVQANPAEARKWYERARELGAPEASDRLTALNAR